MILPYLNTEQISSGILADTIGSGRVAIATKFRYALELIYSNKTCPPGMTIGRFARGILVDPAGQWFSMSSLSAKTKKSPPAAE
jgi:hypothetical protein